MSFSKDISNLFKQFGGEPKQYKEFAQLQAGDESLERWPSLGAVKAEVADIDDRSVEQDVLVETAPVSAPVVASEPLPVVAAKPAFGSLKGLRAQLEQLAQEQPVVEAAPVASIEQPEALAAKVIAVISAKGGVGKSTLSANLAMNLARDGLAVLAVDLDPQNALHHHLGVTHEDEAVQALPGIAGQSWREQCQESASGVFLLPYGEPDEEQREQLEREIAGDRYWLQRHLAALELADDALVVLDTPPGPSVYLRQALSVADLVLVVTLPDAASYTTLPQVERLIERYTQSRERPLEVCYLVNQVDRARQLNKDITQVMLNSFKERLLGLVHRDQAISEALAFNQSVLEYAPNGQGSVDLLQVTDKVREKLLQTAAAAAS